MKINLYIVFICVFLINFTFIRAVEIDVFSQRPAQGMSRADICYFQPSTLPQAALVLAPGFNGNGATLILDKKWQDYAIKNKLILVGLSFASTLEDIKNGKGYYYVEKGAGKKLLTALDSITPRKLPIYIYGFSGGAHFTSRFVEWIPSRVRGWCAYSAGWWTSPQERKMEIPPGIVACGEEDNRLGASFTYFKEGRKLGRHWLWVNLIGTGHTPSKDLDDFVRSYFEIIIQNQKTPLWLDLERGTEVNSKFADKMPSSTGFMPDKSLLPQWKLINGLK